MVLGFMVLNATFNNISVTLWGSVILVEETRVPGENHRPTTSHSNTITTAPESHGTGRLMAECFIEGQGTGRLMTECFIEGQGTGTEA